MSCFILSFLLMTPFFLLANTTSVPTENEILESSHTPLTAIYGIPSTNIFGVNVINGDYHYACVDFALPGSNPLILQRTYCSSRFQCGGFWNYWSHNMVGTAMTYPSTCKKYFHVITSGSVSGDIPFKTAIEKRTDPLKINKDILRKGVTNSGKGEISGRTNIKNIRTIHSHAGVNVINGDGTENFYHCVSYSKHLPDHHSENNLKFTKRPNGLKTTYETEGHILNKVKALTHAEEVSNQIAFTFPTGNPIKMANLKKPFSIDANSDEGKLVRYFFEFHDTEDYRCPNVLMNAAGSNYFPTEYYTYTNPEDGSKLSNRYGYHHRVAIEYYKKGDTMSVYGENPQTLKKSHRDRVRQISMAVNNHHDLRPICQFAYYKNKETKKAFTDVYDSCNFLTRFHYSSKDYRLSSIERYKGSNKRSIYRRENFHFGAKSTPLEGDLLFKTVENKDGVIHFAEEFEYDERGNVLKKNCIFKTFTGANTPPIVVKGDLSTETNCSLKGGEVKSTHYTYNALNLLVTEHEGRLETLFTYHKREGKETNLTKSILVQQDGKILKRQFYEFDLNAGCTLKIEDDGYKSSPEDLTGVKCRKILRMKNRTTTFAGLPIEIDLWSSNGLEEHRISRTVLDYDSHGYVQKESYYDANNAFVYQIEKTNDLRGNAIIESDPIGQKTHRKFNLYGSLIQLQGPDLNYLKEYTYDWQQRPIKETLKCTDGIELSTYRDYDLEGRLVKIQDSYGFTTKFAYNAQGRPVEIIYPPIRTETGEWITPKIRKKYNFLGNLIAEIDANGAVTTYKPNDAGLPLQISFPDGTSEEFHYSLYGELLEKKERNNSKVLYAYDALSRLISETTYDCDGKLLKEISKKYSGSLLVSETDEEGVKTKYKYDFAGRVLEIRKGNRLTKYVYDALGRIDEEWHYFGDNDQDYIATKFEYDLLNRVIARSEVDATGRIYTKTRTAYDASNHVISTTKQTHGGEATTKNTYDPRGNLSSTTDALGNTTYYRHHYDFLYEGINLPCLEMVDPKGVKTMTLSDAKGSPVSTKMFSPSGKLLSNVEYYYDLNGKMVRKEHHLPNETIFTLYEYDSCSRLIHQVNGAGTSEQIATSFIYNHRGELSENQYANGTSKHSLYDGIGRLAEEWSNDKSVHYHYIYNKKSQPTIVENLNTHKKTVRKYSSEGALLSEKFENGLKICYVYDRMNRLVECIYPDGTSVKQTYSPVFLTKSERIKNGQKVYQTEFKNFDRTGKPRRIVFPQKSGTLELEYDPLTRAISIIYPFYQEKEICYDSRGTLVSKIVNGDLQQFKHDHLQQLTQEKTALYSHRYKNDALNRQISVDGQQQTHNALLQLVQGADETYTYDAKGRRTKDSKTQFTYDSFDRLITIEQDNSTWTYTYDSFNRKMSRTCNGETLYYLYNNHEEIGSYSSNNECIDLKVLSGGEESMPMAIELGENLYSPIFSSQRHIVGLVEMKSGKLADLSFLTMFGKDLKETPLSPWRFCGKRHETSSIGIIDFGFRCYHPKSAQWLMQDPLGQSGGPNLYAYVKNSPASYIDRYGLMSVAISIIPEQDKNPYDTIDFSGNTSAELPQITYNDNFEKTHNDLILDGGICEGICIENYWKPSCISDLGLTELPEGRRIGFTNGVNNSFKDYNESSTYLSSMIGGFNIHGVYNATHGLMGDAEEYIYGYQFTATEPVRLLHQEWNDFFKDGYKDVNYLQICHSQGAVNVRNALIDYPEELRKHIDVLAIAPGGYIFQRTCAQVQHYRAAWYRDLIPHFDGRGSRCSKDTTTQLKSHPDAPWHDHLFTSPTYYGVLEHNIKNYIEQGKL